MNRTMLSTTMGLFGLVALSLPAAAGDWNNGDGSLKGRGAAAVPVPSASAVADDGNTRGWYLRGTLGYAGSSNGKISSSGTDVGVYSSYGQLDGPASIGIGFGAYLNNNVRWDLTGDFRAERKINRSSVTKYQATTTKEAEAVNVLGFDPAGAVVSLSTRSFDVHTFDFERTEDVKAANQTFLANMYFEPFAAGAFRPYVGAGLGFTVGTVGRAYQEKGKCSGTVQVITDPFDGSIGSRPRPVCTAIPDEITRNGAKSDLGVGLAAALQAGIGYALTENLVLDIGYRFLWEGATVSIIAPAGAGNDFSKIDLGDRQDHEIRTSLRWAIK
jgi:opacity protein-like surface antigen